MGAMPGNTEERRSNRVRVRDKEGKLNGGMVHEQKETGQRDHSMRIKQTEKNQC